MTMGEEVLLRKRMAREVLLSLQTRSIQPVMLKMLLQRMMLPREAQARRVEEEVGSEAVQQGGNKTPD
jgi:hypothetical protein